MLNALGVAYCAPVPGVKEAPPWDVDDCSFRSGYLVNSLENLFRKDLPNFNRLLSDGSQIGMNFSYAKQEKPNGIAEHL